MQEVLLIALVVLLFFGGRKIPELMKGIGKGVRSFKEGMNGMEKEISPENTDKKSSRVYFMPKSTQTLWQRKTKRTA